MVVYGGPHAALALLWMELQGLDVGCNAEKMGWVGWEKGGLRVLLL